MVGQVGPDDGKQKAPDHCWTELDDVDKPASQLFLRKQKTRAIKVDEIILRHPNSMLYFRRIGFSVRGRGVVST
ncbi:hypothetical protein PM082_008791 [Marasmius tenuissimus]|nr:hypothetical protein PM082_008791 [Marasmius tenuissimus]